MNKIIQSVRKFFELVVLHIKALKDKEKRTEGFARLKRDIQKVLPYGRTIEKIYLMILFVSFIFLFFKSGSYITEDVVLFLVVAVGGLFILRALRNKIYFPKIFTLLFAALFIWSLISVIFSINVYNSILGLIELFTAGVIAILGYDLVYGKYSRRWILNAYTIVTVGVLVYGIARYIMDKTALIYPLGFPVYIGSIILLILPFSLSSGMKTRGAKQILFHIANTIILVAVVLTFSKAIYVLALCEVLVFIGVNLFLGRKGLLKKKFYMPYLFIFVITLLLSILLHFKTSGTIPFTTSSFADRNITPGFHFTILRQAWDSFLARPLFGSGLNNFRLISLYHLHGPWQLAYYAYNEIAEMFVSTGVIGGLLFTTLLGYIVFTAVTKKNYIKIFVKQSPESLELFIGICATLLLSLYSPILHVPLILFTFFLFVGIFLKGMNVDNVNRYYFGNLTLGILNGFSVFFIVIAIYFFVSNYQFNSIKSTITGTSNSTKTVSALQTLIKFNPLNTEYSSVLAQIYLSQSNNSKAMDMNNLAMKYNSQSPYLSYYQALIYYFENNIKLSKTLENKLLKDAPYADPSFYLLHVQYDQSASNSNSLFKNDLLTVVKNFPVNSDYYLYQPIFSSLGFSDSLAKVYLELSLLTNNQAYSAMAQQFDPQSFNTAATQ